MTQPINVRWFGWWRALCTCGLEPTSTAKRISLGRERDETYHMIARFINNTQTLRTHAHTWTHTVIYARWYGCDEWVTRYIGKVLVLWSWFVISIINQSAASLLLAWCGTQTPLICVRVCVACLFQSRLKYINIRNGYQIFIGLGYICNESSIYIKKHTPKDSCFLCRYLGKDKTPLNGKVLRNIETCVFSLYAILGPNSSLYYIYTKFLSAIW